jgi:uncharacterized membrane protein YgcG
MRLNLYRGFAILLIALLAFGSAGAALRTLYWRALEVRAHLDRDGRLHVRERHAMVFDGAWNGGERVFRVERGQRLQFEGLSRINARGGVHRLHAGDLSGTDQYRWIDDRTLRWRSRLPSDPPFRNTEQIFEINYVLSNILVPRGDTFVLDHDFAFPDRQWPIRLFNLDFDSDEVWQAQGSFPGRLERKDLHPGMSVVLTLPFRYVGAGAPAGLRLPAPAPARVLLILALLGFVAWRVAAFFLHEKRYGRYASLPSLEQIDDAWLADRVFKLRPEVVGAAWDSTTSTPEVAAVLARLTAERKLAIEVRQAGPWFWRRDVLHLTLLHERDLLNSYERKLVGALFFYGDTTDTDAIREHYRKTGFDPAAKIRTALSRTLKGRGDGVLPSPSARASLVFLLAAWALGAVALWRDPTLFYAAGYVVLFAILAYGMVWAFKRTYADAVDWLFVRAAFALAPLLVFAAALTYLVATEDLTLGWCMLTGLALLCAALFNSGLNAMRTRSSPEFTLLRKNLLTARRYFARELGERHPRLRDAWLPYLLAFDLGPRVDRWFRSYGRSSGKDTTSLSTSTGAPTSLGSWSGGGGTFAGAGATGTWIAAVSGIAAGVAAPNSGGGSGSGAGGGGGSSGGGGGGGW